MLLKPSPAPLDGQLRSERDVARHRRLYCSHYDKCLDESIRRNWQGFTCMRCPLSDQAENKPALGAFANHRRGDRFTS